jgi:hypothetical protein
MGREVPVAAAFNLTVMAWDGNWCTSRKVGKPAQRQSDEMTDNCDQRSQNHAYWFLRGR